MRRKATGKPLTLRPIRVDEDVWAAILKLRKEFATINAGLRAALLCQVKVATELIVDDMDEVKGQEVVLEAARAVTGDLLPGVPGRVLQTRVNPNTWRRGPRQKGDAKR